MSVIRTVKSLFRGPKIANTPNKRDPEEYFNVIWCNKLMYTGIKDIAEMEHKSIKNTANELIRVGISRYMAGLMKQHTKNERLLVDSFSVFINTILKQLYCQATHSWTYIPMFVQC